MSSAAQIAANRQNAQFSTGPRTPEGKAKSARNATRLGLFTSHDFVLPEDQPTYDALVESFLKELAPTGPLEETYALEIIRASWRLQRCAKVESDLADRALNSGGLDPMQDEAAMRTQTAVDRARAQATTSLRRATAELRRLQTERQTRIELAINEPETLGLTDYRECLKTIAVSERNRLLARKNAGLDSFQAIISRADHEMAQDLGFADLLQPAPRPVANAAA